MAYPAETTTLRWQGAMSSGPYLAGREQLSAYYVLDCENEERAHAIAVRLLDWHVTAVEVRAVHDSIGIDGG